MVNNALFTAARIANQKMAVTTVLFASMVFRCSSSQCVSFVSIDTRHAVLSSVIPLDCGALEYGSSHRWMLKRKSLVQCFPKTP